MSQHVWFILIFGSIFECFYSIFVTDRISKREAKKSCYNCDECGNFKCYYHYCKKQRLERGA